MKFIAKFNSFKEDSRHRIVLKNTFYSLISKGITMLTGFILIPLSLELVSKSELGLWLAISSFLGWLSLLDLGVGNGLRNKLTESFTRGDQIESKSLISTAYLITAVVFGTAIIVFTICSYFVNWNNFLNAPLIDAGLLRNIVIITFAFFALQMIIRLIYTIHMASHKIGIVDLLSSLGQVLIIIFIYLAILFDNKNNQFLILVLINNLIPFGVLLFASLYTFYWNRPELRPSFKYLDFTTGKSIFGLGLKFLIIQLAGFFMIGSHQFIIGKLISQESVVIYSIPHKLYSVIFILWLLFTAPYWSLLTEAYERQDYKWIIDQKKKLLTFFYFLPILGILSFCLAPFVYSIWVGTIYQQDIKLDLSILLFYLVLCYNSTIVVFLNAFSKTKTQMIASVLSAIVMVLILFLFEKNSIVNLYIVPFISSLCLLVAGIAVTINLHKILKIA